MAKHFDLALLELEQAADRCKWERHFAAEQVAGLYTKLIPIERAQLDGAILRRVASGLHYGASLDYIDLAQRGDLALELAELYERYEQKATHVWLQAVLVLMNKYGVPRAAEHSDHYLSSGETSLVECIDVIASLMCNSPQVFAKWFGKYVVSSPESATLPVMTQSWLYYAAHCNDIGALVRAIEQLESEHPELGARMRRAILELLDATSHPPYLLRKDEWIRIMTR